MRHFIFTILLCILLAIGYSCTNGSIQNNETNAQLIELDDSLYFFPREKELSDIMAGFDSIVRICSLTHNHTGEAMIHHICADLQLQTGHTALAFNEARKLMENSENEVEDGIYYLTLSNIDMELHLYDKARERLLGALERLKDEPILQTRVHLHLLELDVNLRNFDKAWLRIREIESLNAQHGIQAIPHNLQMRFYAWKASAYLYSGDTDKGLEIIEQFEQNKELQACYGFQNIRHRLRRNYYTTIGKYDEAFKHAISYLEECRKQKSYSRELDAYAYIADILEKKGEPEKAIAYYQAAISLKDSLSKNILYHEEGILKEVELLDELENELWKKRHTLLRSIFIGGILVFIIIIIMIFITHRSKRKVDESNRQLQIAQKKADESIKAKSMFLSNMSHEIRTPLNAISGFSEVLISQPDMDKEMLAECNNIIRENSTLLLKLLNDVLDFSNLDIEKMSFTLSRHNVVNICRSLTSMLQSINHTGNAKLEFVTELDELYLHTDENRLRQLLINLLINATKFTAEGTITLSIEVDKWQHYAIFAVTDTGCGIPLDQQKSVFSRFEKLHEHVNGSGLGLSICQNIIHHLGGDIWIDSSYTRGARFVFSHPIHQNPAS